MASEPQPEPDQPSPRVRRRVGTGSADEGGGRSGCLLAGAVLGIVVGATFAFYGLPPILRHFYGEQHIAVGQAYEGEAKTVSVTYLGTNPDPLAPAFGASGASASQPAAGFYMTLKVLTNKTWNPKLTDFSLQFSGVDGWQPADASAGVETVDGRLRFPLTVELLVAFHFARPIEAGVVPRYLHLADPLVRFELAPPR